jgi:methylmalonyl-CoA epimerase
MIPLVLDHVGIATPSIAGAARHYELLTGTPCSPVEAIPAHGVNVAFIGQIELLEPSGEGSALHRFLERRGPGLHHVAYRVPDLADALRRLESDGAQLIDAAPRPGARGHQVAFVHPKSAGGVLWELVEVK